MDVTFFHPGGSNQKGLQGPFIPIGIVGLASELKKRGFKVQIVNLVLEKALNPKLDIYKIVKKYMAPIVAIDLHWFVHSYESIELARMCKSIDPNCKIILGGLTASIFDTEIISEFPYIDAIICGDAEKPLAEYSKKALKDKNYSKVSNLTFRKDNRIKKNNIKYISTTKDLDEIDFLDFRIIKNWKKNFNLTNKDYKSRKKNQYKFSGYYNEKNPMRQWTLYMGRGCPFNCSFCGGSKTSFNLACGRRNITLRSTSKLVEDITRLHELRVADLLYISHSPLTIPNKIHDRLLKNLRKEIDSLNFGFLFEDVPFYTDTKIIKQYMGMFNSRKSLAKIYFAGMDNVVSKFNNFPSAHNMIKLNSFFVKNGIKIEPSFLIGLPKQTKEITLAVKRLLSKLKNTVSEPRIYNGELHPGSQIHQFPEKYGVTLRLRTFKDYFTFLKNKKDKSMILGYDPHNNIKAEKQRRIFETFL